MPMNIGILAFNFEGKPMGEEYLFILFLPMPQKMGSQSHPYFMINFWTHHST